MGREGAREELAAIEKELAYLGLLDKAREIFREFGGPSALSYIKSSHRLLSKVYHPDLNPRNPEKAARFQQRLNRISELIEAASDEDLFSLLEGGGKREEGVLRKKILVVEDEFGLQETLRDVFRMEGYDVRVAVDGENGYQAYLQFRPDLVFTDVVMPIMSGIELVRRIRRHDPDIKVIYVSGFFGLRNVKDDLREEMDRYGYPYLAKPFRISAMLELVADYLKDRPFRQSSF